MKTVQQSSDTSQKPHPGLDLFKISGRSISGLIPSYKTGDLTRIRQPFTSQLEERLAMFLEYNPRVSSYQRGDISIEFAAAYKIFLPIPSPYCITYTYADKTHTYLPDYIGTLAKWAVSLKKLGMFTLKMK